MVMRFYVLSYPISSYCRRYFPAQSHNKDLVCVQNYDRHTHTTKQCCSLRSCARPHGPMVQSGVQYTPFPAFILESSLHSILTQKGKSLGSVDPYWIDFFFSFFFFYFSLRQRLFLVCPCYDVGLVIIMRLTSPEKSDFSATKFMRRSCSLA